MNHAPFKHHKGVNFLRFAIIALAFFSSTVALRADGPLQVTADEMVRTLKSNTARAELLYGNRELIISGVVVKVARGCCNDTKNYHYVYLEPNGSRPVTVKLKKETPIEEIAMIDVGSTYLFLCHTKGLNSSGGMQCEQGVVVAE